MFTIVSLISVTLAAVLWPDSQSDEDQEPERASDVAEDGQAGVAILDAGGADAEGASAGSYADDLISASLSENLDAADSKPTIIGTVGDDVMVGSDEGEVFRGGDGADVVHAGGGDDELIGSDDDYGDELIGGDGHDIFEIGYGDVVEGGSGDDAFNIEADAAAVIKDYSPDDDQICVYYDPNGPIPTLAAEEVEDGFALRAGGQLVATFPGVSHLDVDRFHLVPEPA